MTVPDTSFGAGATPPVVTRALWQWDLSTTSPTVSGYPQGNGCFKPTKTGLMPEDLQAFVGVPLQFYGNPPTPVPTPTILQWIRWAEDKVEQDTSIVLCQTWVAAPPTPNRDASLACGLIVSTESGSQVQGYDYDLYDAPYDFMFSRAQDEGWMMQTLRYRPIRSAQVLSVSGASGIVGFDQYFGIKNIAYIYPLLNTYFRVPISWEVEDQDAGLVRLVPAQNVQMLPLYAMQLAFMGFAENVPGGLWFQYVAGLTPNDYRSRFSFMRELVLLEAAQTALATIQGTVNFGALSTQAMVDGLSYRVQYGQRGAFSGLIDIFEGRANKLREKARNMVSGPMLNVL